MFEDCKTSIEKAKNSVKWFEREIAKLEAEYVSLPSVGYHRPRYLEVRKRLRHMREALAAEKDQLEWLEQTAAAEKDLDIGLTPEERADFEKFMQEQDALAKERVRRDREAEKRREAFQVIDGGRSED